MKHIYAGLEVCVLGGGGGLKITNQLLITNE